MPKKLLQKSKKCLDNQKRTMYNELRKVEKTENPKEDMKMAKYLVVVNQKYIVKVVAESAGGAEHAILDNIDGIQYAQAFTAKELTTSTFEYYFDTCSTISYAELKQIAADYEAAWKDVAAAKEELRKREAELEAARKALALAQANVDTCKWNIDQAERIAREYEEGLGIKKEN